MIQFVQPIWLWATAGIAVPIFIHLWNVKRGRTLKVGSIAFLVEHARAHSKSLKLSELLLLLLRCLLLIALAFLLAGTFFQSRIETTNEKGWLLIERTSVKEAYHNYKPTIDSLIKGGFTFHYFDPGFEEQKLDQALKKVSVPLNESKISYWTLLKELQKKVSASLPVYLFTSNSLSRFEGNRPEVALNLRWLTYSAGDTASKWLEKAYETINDSVRVVIGNSNASGTSYAYQNASYQMPHPDFDISTHAGKTRVNAKDTTYAINTVEADTSTLAITIYTDKFNTDAAYLKAALDAIRDFTKCKIRAAVVKRVEDISSERTWLFWLSEEAVPASLLKNKVFIYQPGKTVLLYSPIIGDENLTTADNLFIYKRIQNDHYNPATVLWKDGFGDKVLSVVKGKTEIYYFYSRFSPQWNDMVWNHQFPQMVYNLIFHQREDTSKGMKDKRIIDEQQLLPLTTNKQVFSKQHLINKTDLTKALWLLAFVLLLAEKIISFRTKKKEVYG